MRLSIQIKETNWLKILFFYGVILIGTYLARKLPNILNLFLEQITDIPFSFNYNHGFVTLIVAVLFYRFGDVKQRITLLGNNKIKSLLFPIILFVCYSAFGINNSHGVDKHFWAFIFCLFAFIYNLMEEYAWRGYLIDSLVKLNYALKSIISGIFLEYLAFIDFQQF